MMQFYLSGFQSWKLFLIKQNESRNRWSISFCYAPIFFFRTDTCVLGGVGPASSLSVCGGRVPPTSAFSQRGVSYPPPSPRGLTRTQPVPQSRNPPLVKTRHLVSVAGVTATAATNDTTPTPACLVEAAYSNNEQTILPSKIFSLIILCSSSISLIEVIRGFTSWI